MRSKAEFSHPRKLALCDLAVTPLGETSVAVLVTEGVWPGLALPSARSRALFPCTLATVPSGRCAGGEGRETCGGGAVRRRFPWRRKHQAHASQTRSWSSEAGSGQVKVAHSTGEQRRSVAFDPISPHFTRLEFAALCVQTRGRGNTPHSQDGHLCGYEMALTTGW